MQSLKTGDLEIANKLKHAIVGQFKRQIDQLSKGSTPAEIVLTGQAFDYRKLYRAASPSVSRDDDDPFSERERIHDDIRERAIDLQDLHGVDAARKFYEVATGTATPLRGLVDQWLDGIKGSIAEQTRVQHRAAVNGLILWCGEGVSVEEITQRKAGEFISTSLMQSGRARKTVKRHLSSLSAFWKWLKKPMGYVEINPWTGHEIGKDKDGPGRKGFDDAALISLLSGASTRRYQDALQDLIRLALITGARLDEICALRGSDIERREDGVWINIKKGKTDAATRSIPVHSSVAAIVTRRAGANGEYFIVDGLIAGGPDKKRSWYVSKAFKRYRDGVGVTGRFRDFHALRKTFVEVMEGAEVPVATVQLLVGHSRPGMTFGVYSKGQRVDLRKSIDKLNYSDEVMRLIEKPQVQSGLPRRPLERASGKRRTKS